MELRSSYGVRRLTRAHLAELGQGAGGEGTLPKRDGTEPRSGSDVSRLRSGRSGGYRALGAEGVLKEATASCRQAAPRCTLLVT